MHSAFATNAPLRFNQNVMAKTEADEDVDLSRRIDFLWQEALAVALAGEVGREAVETQMSVSFHYGVWNGWQHCRFAIGSVHVAHTVNGWHRGDLELIDAAIAMFGRTMSAVARFQEEPGEFRWQIGRLEVNRIRVRIHEFDDWDVTLPEESGRLIFNATCGVVSFAQAIHDGFKTWLDEARAASTNADNENMRTVQEHVNTLRDHLRQLHRYG
jgi:hypothetical protein